MAPKKLPPKGGTTANKPRAVTQRTATAVRQRVQQDTASLRALQDNMRRNAERNARQIPADPAPRVRRVGPGGANPKPQNRLSPGAKPAQLPPGNRGGAITPAGSSAVTKPRSSAKPSSSNALPPGTKGGPLSTRGQRALPPGSRGSGNALPPGQRGGAVKPVKVTDLGNTKPTNPWGSGTRPPATPYNGPRGTALPGGKPTAAPGRPAAKPAASTGTALSNGAKFLKNLKGGLATTAIAALGGSIVDNIGQAGGRAIGNALVPVGRRLDDMLPGINSKDEANRRAKPQMTAAERAKAVRLTQAQPKPVASTTPKPKPRPVTQAAAAAPAPRRAQPAPVSATNRQFASAATAPTQTVVAPPAPNAQYNGNDEPGRLGQSEGGYAGTPTPTKPTPKPAAPKKEERRGTGRDAMVQNNIKRARRRLTIELD